VLVVDDEAAVRQTAGEMLRSLGYSAVACPGGAEALELLDSGEPAVSCVLLDLTMPGMDGQEVLRQISIRHPRIPVVLSSGFSRSSVTGLSENPCYRGFLHKPYSSSELEQTMRSVMS
jgi:CheY-like chemotaxis protein